MRIPPPHKRLCKKHGRPISPSDWLNGCRTSKCAKCRNECKKSPAAQERRAKRYDGGDIRCNKHPGKKVNRSSYVLQNLRRCAWCKTHRADGSLPLSVRRHNYKNAYKNGYRKIMGNRNRLNSRMHGFELFERLTGIRLPEGWKDGKAYHRG